MDPPAFSRLAMTCRLAPLRTNLLRAAMAVAVVGCALGVPAARPAAAVSLVFRYDYDAGGFFGTDLAPSPARAALEFAGRAFSAFTDILHPILPGGSNTWTARFLHPATGQLESLANLVVPTNQVIVFVGARDLSGGRVAEASRGAYAFSQPAALTPQFSNAVINRGQGSTQTDFGPWGGSIAFDTHTAEGQPRNWHYDPVAPPDQSAYDFLSVAIHELAHLFGFGVSASGSFAAHVQNGHFGGPATTALYGGSTPLQAGGDHWASYVTSPPFAGDAPRPALGPFSFPGERFPLTPLDYAALSDVGWQTPPELLRLPGDVNGDLRVDGADWLVWQRGLGGFGGTPGDANGDLQVDEYDGWLIRHFFGATAETGAMTGAPEPTSLASALAGAALLASARRRLT